MLTSMHVGDPVPLATSRMAALTECSLHIVDCWHATSRTCLQRAGFPDVFWEHSEGFLASCVPPAPLSPMLQAREIEQLMSDPERWDAMSEADKTQKQQDLAQSQGRGQMLQSCAAKAISTCAYSCCLCRQARSQAGACIALILQDLTALRR